MANAPPPAPPVEMDDRARELLAEARVAKTAAGAAIEQFENRVWAAAWDRGYAQGWSEGYRYALWQIEQARNQFIHSPTTVATARPAPEAAPPLDEDADDDGPSARDVVYGIVADKAGMRGVEIVAAAQAAGTPIKERTVRTALHRLKRDGVIVNVDERWYLPKAAPYHGGAP